jgi:hypothetical protein
MRRANRILKTARVMKVDFLKDDWFYFSHQHMDWDGIGDLGPSIRSIMLEAHACVFRKYASAMTAFGAPYQLWLSLAESESGQDAVYRHSPNPHSEFPAVFNDVSWGVPRLEALLSTWLPEFRLVVGKRDWNYVVYAEGFGVQLKTPNAILNPPNHSSEPTQSAVR